MSTTHRVTGPASRSPVLARRGMAATSHPLATQIALDILKQGGTAVDAAIAANAALCLMEPTGCGLGGDLFALVWDPASHKLHGLNGSGHSAQGLTLAHLKQILGNQPHIPLLGPLSVTVPGAVAGWFALQNRFGRLEMAQILAPTIAYARAGVAVPKIIAAAWNDNLKRFEQGQAQIPQGDGLRTFAPRGRAPLEGEVFTNPDLAWTLERLAVDGRAAFYSGEIAQKLVAYLGRVGSFLQKIDFQEHQSTWVEPVSVNYRGYDIYELPPSSQGIAALQMLNMLEGYDLQAMGHNSADYLHLHVEVKKLAFADRARYYADPDVYPAPVTALCSKDYAAQRRREIDPQRAQARVSAGSLGGSDTVYLTVADSTGMMVSLIQSNYWGMGGGLVPDGLGFMLQNRGAQFTLEEGHPNAYAPGKRPFHTIIPAFVLKEGEPWLSLGVMGGEMQPQGHVQVLCNIIDFGMDIQAAGDSARYFHFGDNDPDGHQMTDGGSLALERGISRNVREALVQRGHQLRLAPGSFGGYQAIYWDRVQGVYHGASEMRKDGQAAGY
ncbi:gamma-glutamyltransferase [Anthocerotibacter panamensis]|uniref:gamma-glutamyltransferase n=1 Tax=Anthocerotibacter panamensis TaxID=2857077 RepID=UPI001FD99171|nr:gamma-glutamyltransferase [Anthocerotibacter panamensis]